MSGAPMHRRLVQGDLVAGDNFEDEWLVVDAGRFSVRLIDTTHYDCWEWALRHDGIRVAQCRVRSADDREWVAMPINSFPPPKAVEIHLRPPRRAS